jgi:hypothetical protein
MSSIDDEIKLALEKVKNAEAFDASVDSASALLLTFFRRISEVQLKRHKSLQGNALFGFNFIF